MVAWCCKPSTIHRSVTGSHSHHSFSSQSETSPKVFAMIDVFVYSAVACAPLTSCYCTNKWNNSKKCQQKLLVSCLRQWQALLNTEGLNLSDFMVCMRTDCPTCYSLIGDLGVKTYFLKAQAVKASAKPCFWLVITTSTNFASGRYSSSAPFLSGSLKCCCVPLWLSWRCSYSLNSKCHVVRTSFWAVIHTRQSGCLRRGAQCKVSNPSSCWGTVCANILWYWVWLGALGRTWVQLDWIYQLKDC